MKIKLGKNTGIWIDHKHACIVCINLDGISIKEIASNVEKHTRLSGGSRSKTAYGPQDIASESKHDNKYRHHLDKYYEIVIKEIGTATSLFVFGPGEAKKELLKHIETSSLRTTKIAGVATRDKMTEKQIVVYVKEFYSVI